ncbi:MAG TPA: SDR family oxidoreductase [Thermoanaerobaculia bacterium]|jgi:NAD(P)-dependent dehydrogenase (short-subunit alcohol dehydrogenase family)
MRRGATGGAARVALVTGAGIRVGRAIALALAESGADVAVHFRSSEGPARETVRKIRGLGRRAEAFAADLADPVECRRLIADVLRSFGALDFLVHSAANFHRAAFEATDEVLWDSALHVNARAGFLLAQAAAPSLRRRKGRVVLISDFLAVRPVRNYLAHAVSKAAAEGLVRALAVELAPEVSVNGVSPGTVMVPQGTPRSLEERWAAETPLRRNGNARDVAEAVVFLCTGPSFVTGQILRVDGGKSLS